MDDYRETIWGIRPKDRGWFQLLTLIGGTAGSVILTLLELDSLSAGAPVSEAARNIALGVGASFVASGFIAWGTLQAKEIPMLIADWIRDATERRRKRWREEGREQGRKEGREEAFREIYGPDYIDSQERSRPQPPATLMVGMETMSAMAEREIVARREGYAQVYCGRQSRKTLYIDGT